MTKEKETEKKTGNKQITIEEIAIFCKRKGFVYPSSEIYGGIGGFFDYGPLGAELFTNIRNSFWNYFVHRQDNMVGIEATIISHPRTWIASGHVASFGDLVLSCVKCGSNFRADHFIEDTLKIIADGIKAPEINELIKKNNLSCPKCKGAFKEIKEFNLLFETKVGAATDSSAVAYLRGETAQGMFLNFKNVVETSRVKLPFGIVQVGRCFRNEISPRDFTFRMREFQIGEFEFFIHPNEKKCALLTEHHIKCEINLLDAETQEKGKKDLKKTTIGNMLKENRLEEWHGYWLSEQIMWFKELGINMENLKIREHVKSELSHYSSATFDLDYAFPFGSKEVAGNANRGQYDLKQHINESKEKLDYFDEETKERVIPKVIEPTFGMDRIFLMIVCDAFDNNKERGNTVLHINPKLAPVKAGVFPLVNKDGLPELATRIHYDLKKSIVSFYDKSGSVGRRYARQDEQGTPYCVTVDYDSLKDNTVTIRDRDSTNQKRIKISELKETLRKLIEGEIKF
jgi:glycyl-tRNA synthetase